MNEKDDQLSNQIIEIQSENEQLHLQLPTDDKEHENGMINSN